LRETISARGERKVHPVGRPAERDFLRDRRRRRHRNCAQRFRLRRRRRGARRLGCFFVDLAHEAQAAPRDRLDELLLLAAVADRSPCSVDTVAERGFRHDAPVPDVREQVILAYDAVAVADQMQDKVEHLRLDMNRVARAAELAPVSVDRVVAEQKPHLRMPCHGLHVARSNGGFRT
jgi:hypothetical protein